MSKEEEEGEFEVIQIQEKEGEEEKEIYVSPILQEGEFDIEKLIKDIPKGYRYSQPKNNFSSFLNSFDFSDIKKDPKKIEETIEILKSFREEESLEKKHRKILANIILKHFNVFTEDIGLASLTFGTLGTYIKMDYINGYDYIAWDLIISFIKLKIVNTNEGVVTIKEVFQYNFLKELLFFAARIFKEFERELELEGERELEEGEGEEESERSERSEKLRKIREILRTTNLFEDGTYKNLFKWKIKSEANYKKLGNVLKKEGKKVVIIDPSQRGKNSTFKRLGILSMVRLIEKFNMKNFKKLEATDEEFEKLEKIILSGNKKNLLVEDGMTYTFELFPKIAKLAEKKGETRLTLGTFLHDFSQIISTVMEPGREIIVKLKDFDKGFDLQVEIENKDGKFLVNYKGDENIDKEKIKELDNTINNRIEEFYKKQSEMDKDEEEESNARRVNAFGSDFPSNNNNNNSINPHNADKMDLDEDDEDNVEF